MLWFPILLLSFALCHQSQASEQQSCGSPELPAAAPESIAITVFVHGIISVKPYMSVDNFIRFKRDQISNSPYAYAIELTRKNPFYYQHHAMQELGLQEIDMNTIAPGLAATAFARSYDAMAHKSGYACGQNIYYTFGWSGLLSKKMRVMEAEMFYKALVEILQPYHEKNIFPQLRVIGYSHGGRIALELATAHTRCPSDKKLTVDELILVGMPVVPACAYHVASSLFKKVYHIYSEKDRVQRIDFASVNGLFSNSKFRSNSCIKLSRKLTQINFRIFRLTRDYQQFWKTAQPCCVNRRKLRPAHPGHSEFWSFGWTPKGYRQALPYNPLPAAVFVPYLVQASRALPHDRHILVELHPYLPAICAGPNGAYPCLQLPLLSMHELAALQQDALLFKPENFTYEEFQKHSQEARDVARKLHSKHNPYF